MNQQPAYGPIISQNSEKSIGNGKFSLSDSTGKQLTQEQADYFKDSVVRDENGNLKVMYHGTSNGGFTFLIPTAAITASLVQALTLPIHRISVNPIPRRAKAAIRRYTKLI